MLGAAVLFFGLNPSPTVLLHRLRAFPSSFVAQTYAQNSALSGDCLLNFGRPRFCQIGFGTSTEDLAMKLDLFFANGQATTLF
jgi:hypothetical protein